MPVLPVRILLPETTVRGTLTTEHAASSYGLPVLVLDDPEPSHPEGAVVAHGPGDVTTHGVAAVLHVEAAVEATDAQTRLLTHWREACRAYRERGGLTPASAPEDATAPTSGSTEEREVVGRILLPDNRELRVLRAPDPENGPRIMFRLSPSQSQEPEGFDLTTASALELLRALDRALRLPVLDPEGDR